LRRTTDEDDASGSRRVTPRSDELRLLGTCPVVSESDVIRSQRQHPLTPTADMPATRSPRRHSPRSYHRDPSPRRSTTRPDFSEDDAARRHHRSRHRDRVGDARQSPETDSDTAAPARVRKRSPRPPRTSSPPANVASCQQPQPSTSIRFDSGEINSTPAAAATDDGISLGLDADRCTFETMFRERDVRRQGSRARLPALSDDEDCVDDQRGVHRQRADVDEEQQPHTTLRRWRTLENIHASSTDTLVVVGAGGSGDKERRRMSPTQYRPHSSAGPELDSRRARNKRHSSNSVRYRSIVGFYSDSDSDSAEQSSPSETDEEYRRRRRDDGSGDPWSRGGNRAEQLEMASEEWLEMQRDSWRSCYGDERVFECPSPRRNLLRSTYRILPPTNRQTTTPVLTATRSVARPTTGTLERNNVPQRRVPTTNSSTQTVEITNSLLSSRNWMQIIGILLALFVILITARYIHTLLSKPPEPELDQPPSLSERFYLAKYFRFVSS